MRGPFMAVGMRRLWAGAASLASSAASSLPAPCRRAGAGGRDAALSRASGYPRGGSDGEALCPADRELFGPARPGPLGSDRVGVALPDAAYGRGSRRVSPACPPRGRLAWLAPCRGQTARPLSAGRLAARRRGVGSYDARALDGALGVRNLVTWCGGPRLPVPRRSPSSVSATTMSSRAVPALRRQWGSRSRATQRQGRAPPRGRGRHAPSGRPRLIAMSLRQRAGAASISLALLISRLVGGSCPSRPKPQRPVPA